MSSYLSSFYKVHNFDILLNPNHDLRDSSFKSNHEAVLRESDYIIFLAYDVGGARYLKENQGQFHFLKNNSLVMLNTFAFLKEFESKFIFASSEMAHDINSPYGVLKALGEDFTYSLGGVFVRFWNVYDYEVDRSKSHVITDFVNQAIHYGQINMLTNGDEKRQFLYSDDCAKAIHEVLKRYEIFSGGDGVDITSFETVSIEKVGHLIASKTDSRLVKGNLNDLTRHQKMTPPRKRILDFWTPEYSLEQGIDLVIEKARRDLLRK